jgi:hypothetical protein
MHMTVKELMEAVDRLHPNQFTQSDKLDWLNRVEQTIWTEIVMTHELPEDIPDEMPVYDSGDVSPTPPDTSPVLLAPDPYSKLYPLWMDWQIAYYNHEVMQQDRAAQVFNEAYGEFRNWYNRQFVPCGMVDHLHLLDRTWGVS